MSQLLVWTLSINDFTSFSVYKGGNPLIGVQGYKDKLTLVGAAQQDIQEQDTGYNH